MATWAIKVDMPPKGALETGDGGPGDLTDEAMAEEQKYRKKFLDFVEPKLEGLLDRPAQRAANVVGAEIHGADTWSKLNRYLLLVTTDIGGPGFDPKAIVPAGAEVSVIGAYDLITKLPRNDKAEPDS